MAVLALAAAVCPFAGGLPRRAATALSDAKHATGKKRPRVAPVRDSSSACLTTTTRNIVVTAAGEMSSKELLQKRQASELDALRGILKNAELISRRGARKGGAAPTAGKKERFLASNQRAKPIEEDFKETSVKKRKISTLAVVEHKQKQIRALRMSPEERTQLAGRLSMLCAKLPLPRHIVEFLEKQFGDADSHGEIEINFDSVQDSVLFELKMQLDMVAVDSKDDKVAEESRDEKVAEESRDEKVVEESKADKVAEESKPDKLDEESKDEKVAEESKGEVVREKKEEEYADISGGLSRIIETGSKPSLSSSGDSGDTRVQVQRSTEAKRVQDAQQRAAPKAIDMRRLLYRANLRRQLLEMERAALPDQRIDPRELQRLGIKEYGHPSLMRQLGLVLKVDA